MPLDPGHVHMHVPWPREAPPFHRVRDSAYVSWKTLEALIRFLFYNIKIIGSLPHRASPCSSDRRVYVFTLLHVSILRVNSALARVIQPRISMCLVRLFRLSWYIVKDPMSRAQNEHRRLNLYDLHESFCVVESRQQVWDEGRRVRARG